MNEKFEINPFDRLALTDYRLLAGRNDEFRRIRLIIRRSAKSKDRLKSMLITGERGVGKTSFLNLIENECPNNNIVPVRIDLTKSNTDNSSSFFWHFFNQTLNKLFSINLLGGKGGEIDKSVQAIFNSDGILEAANWIFKTPILRKNFLSNPNVNFEFTLFIEDLRLMLKTLRKINSDLYNDNTKFLFLVDESQRIYSNDNILEELRFVLQSQDLGIGFVFAGDTTYRISEWENVFGGSYRDFEIINLNYFKESDDVEDFFKKSLNTIGWIDDEIENKLFYRFKLTCRNIFNLSSGKPQFITTIADKMFQRCMAGEVAVLKFDKELQASVKKMLESTDDLDSIQLTFIENLSPKFTKWLAEIFACELYSFDQIYFYTKFILTGDNLLSIEDFTKFCETLIEKDILFILTKTDRNAFVKSKEKLLNDLNKQFLAFESKTDTMKQWLQINSEGKFTFRLQHPAIRFGLHINNELITEKANFVIIYFLVVDEDEFKLSQIINEIPKASFEVNNYTYDNLAMIYKACKRLSESRDRELLFIRLSNSANQKIETWSLYNYNEKGKTIAFRESPTTINKLKAAVEKFNDQNSNYQLDIDVDKIEKPDLEILQRKIISSGDIKKIGVIADDKMEDLVQHYLKEGNIQSSVEDALFFFKLFQEGHELKIRDLNNASYVFIENSDLDKALQLLTEGKRRIELDTIYKEEQSTAVLLLYNMSILYVLRGDIYKALNQFREVLNFYESHDVDDNGVGALKVLELNGLNEIIVEEVKEKEESNSLNVLEFARKNIGIIENSQAPSSA